MQERGGEGWLVGVLSVMLNYYDRGRGEVDLLRVLREVRLELRANYTRVPKVI